MSNFTSYKLSPAWPAFYENFGKTNLGKIDKFLLVFIYGGVEIKDTDTDILIQSFKFNIELSNWFWQRWNRAYGGRG